MVEFLRKRIRYFPVLASLCGLLCLLLGGCAEQIASDIVADKIRARLPEEIGPARVYRVRVSQQALDKTIRGRIRWIKIEGEEVEADEGLVVDSIHIELKNVDYDRRRGVLRHIESAHFEGRISETHLNAYVARRIPRAEDISIRIRPESIQASASPKLLGLPIRVWVAGKLQLLDDKRVSFVPDELSVVGINLPEGWSRKLADRLNPLIDLNHTTIPVRLESITVEPAALKVIGSVIYPTEDDGKTKLGT